MIRVFMSVEYRGFATMFEKSAGVPASNRMLNRHRASANKETVLHWHSSFLPRHFKSSQIKYANQKRKPKYQRIKEDLGRTGQAIVNGKLIKERVSLGGQIDNVRKGKTAQMAMAASIVKTSSTGATLFMQVPRYAAIKRKDPSKPQLSKEVTVVTADELESMRRRWVKTFVNGLRIERNVIRKKLG